MWIRIRAVIVEDEPLAAVNFGAADGALVHSLMQHNPHLRGIVLYRPEGRCSRKSPRSCGTDRSDCRRFLQVGAGGRSL
jgi:hypothetical protein